MLNFEEQLQKIFTEEKEPDSGIAIIDDDNSFSFMLKDYLLTSASLKSDLFMSGEKFMTDYRKGDRRKIILDYNFQQGWSGLTILKKIKFVNPSAIVIIVSGQDDLEKAMEMLRNGATDYFLKSNKTVFANILCSLLKIMEMERNRWN